MYGCTPSIFAVVSTAASAHSARTEVESPDVDDGIGSVLAVDADGGAAAATAASASMTATATITARSASTSEFMDAAAGTA